MPSPKSGCSFVSALLSKNRVGQFEGEREKDEGRGSKTPIDPLSCSQRCKPSSGTSSTEARGGSPGRQRGETR